MREPVSLLIVGAGPFGLSIAAQADHLGIDHLVVGEPMGFWKHNMPEGMYLRSDCDWHLDPTGVDTIDRYLGTLGLTRADVEPLSLAFYLEHTHWFQEKKGIEPRQATVTSLDAAPAGSGARFVATLDNGEQILARNVALALGFEYFANVPDSLAELIPSERLSHTCDHVVFDDLIGRRCLIVGGRQSAFEWAALLADEGAAEIHLSHRHPSPAFQEADWSWVPPILEDMIDDPGWFRNLPEEEQEAVNRRLWAEGRLKVEPWLEARIVNGPVSIWPETQVIGCRLNPAGDLTIELDTGQELTVDHVIAATGYRVDVARIPFLNQGDLLEQIGARNGYPTLDEGFQCSTVPGLFFTSMPAAQDFGPFFGFTVAVRTSAILIGRAVSGE